MPNSWKQNKKYLKITDQFKNKLGSVCSAHSARSAQCMIELREMICLFFFSTLFLLFNALFCVSIIIFCSFRFWKMIIFLCVISRSPGWTKFVRSYFFPRYLLARVYWTCSTFKIQRNSGVIPFKINQLCSVFFSHRFSSFCCCCYCLLYCHRSLVPFCLVSFQFMCRCLYICTSSE